MAEAKLCRHCNRYKVSRPCGLCWKHYYDPSIRCLYPSTSKYGRRGKGCFTTKQSLPLPEPTQALPGTPEKVAVIEARMASGLALHHPDDARH